MRKWVVFTDPPIQSMIDSGVMWPFTGSRVVRLEYLRIAPRVCSDFEFAALVREGDRTKLAQFAHSDGTYGLHLFTPAEFLDANLGPSVILHSLNADLTSGLFLRSYAGEHNWPVVGMTHDVSDPTVYRQLLLALFGGVGGHDALGCCSTAVSDVIRRHVSKIKPSNMRLPVMPHGIDLGSVIRNPKMLVRARLGVDSADFVFLYVGRMCGITKADLVSLIRTFWIIFYKQEQVTLVLAGAVIGDSGQEYTRQLEELITSWGAQHRITLIKNPDEPLKHALYSSADAFVSPACSLQESFGISLLEAMAHELPVIASDWSGYRDIVEHGKTGFLFGTKFREVDTWGQIYSSFNEWPAVLEQIQSTVLLDFEACGAQMRELVLNREMAKSMGLRGRRRVEDHYDWAVLLADHQELWNDLLGHSRDAALRRDGLALYPDLASAFQGYASTRDR